MTTTVSAPARPRRGMFFVICAALLWGTVGSASQLLYQGSATNALSIGFFRLAISVPALALACWWQLGRAALKVQRRDLGLMLLIGVMMALYQVCYFAAIQYVGVSIAVLVTLCTAPVIIALLSTVLLRERLSRSVLLALVAALLGTVLLVGIDADGLALTGGRLTGVLLALGSAFGYSVLTLCSRALAGRYHPLQPITFGFAAGALVLLPFALATGLVVSYTAAGWGLMLWLGLVPTALAYVLFLSGMRTTSATVASILTLLEPLTGTLLAVALFHERLSSLGGLGAALLLGAILLLTRARA